MVPENRVGSWLHTLFVLHYHMWWDEEIGHILLGFVG